MACAACNGLPNQGCACVAQAAPCGPGPCDAQEEFSQITPAQAKSSIAQRVMRAQNRARQKVARLGFRPYNVDLVWVKWTGVERGQGYEEVFLRTPIVPSPELVDLSSINLSAVSTGILPLGSIRLNKINGCYTSDQLAGRLRGENGTPHPFDFYYEVYEDGRNGTAERMKFRPVAQPTRRPYGWQITLERISQDGERDGTPAEPAPP